MTRIGESRGGDKRVLSTVCIRFTVLIAWHDVGRIIVIVAHHDVWFFVTAVGWCCLLRATPRFPGCRDSYWIILGFYLRFSRPGCPSCIFLLIYFYIGSYLSLYLLLQLRSFFIYLRGCTVNNVCIHPPGCISLVYCSSCPLRYVNLRPVSPPGARPGREGLFLVLVLASVWNHFCNYYIISSCLIFISFAGCQGNVGCPARPAPVVPASETADGRRSACVCRPSLTDA